MLLTTNQIDTWIDLERALSHVAGQVEDQPTTFGIGYLTMAAHKHKVKANPLGGYGPRRENSASVTLFTASPEKPSTELVTTAATKMDVAQTFGYGLTAFGKDNRKIKAMIIAKYRHAQVSTALAASPDAGNL